MNKSDLEMKICQKETLQYTMPKTQTAVESPSGDCPLTVLPLDLLSSRRSLGGESREHIFIVNTAGAQQGRIL